jgi:hypothetical protein
MYFNTVSSSFWYSNGYRLCSREIGLTGHAAHKQLPIQVLSSTLSPGVKDLGHETIYLLDIMIYNPVQAN